LACELWQQLGLDEFWRQRLPETRERVSWEKVLRLLVVNRLLDPGSEFQVHRQWFVDSAMDELLEEDFAVAGKDRLYRCLDRVLEHKRELFVWLKQKWADLFQADFEVLLYDLTSTYFEGEMEQNGKARRGYSRDGRPDCLQLVIALVVTTDGFPLAYEVMNGNTSERTTLRSFLDDIEKTYGKAKRTWVMDRGIPSEAILKEMREPERETFYLVGTPKGKIHQHEKKWLDLPWQKVRDSVQVKLYQEGGELYVLAKSEGRQAKEMAIRRKRLARLLRKLRAMRKSLPKRDQLLLRIGAAKKEAGRAFGFVKIRLPQAGETVTRQLGHLVGPRHVPLKLGALAATAVLAFFVFANGEFRISAKTVMEAGMRQAAVAPFNGYIKEAPARAGDIVRAGQLLSVLDDRELRLERLKWLSQQEQYVKQHQQALANRNAAQVNITAAQIEQARAQIALLDDQLSKTRLLAGSDGVVVTGDLSQSLGAPVERGQVLFEIAPLDAYRVALEVDERDVSEVAVGQHGRLLLSAAPTDALPFAVKKITPVSTAREGRNYFRVEATLERTPANLRPGMEGVGKIEIGRRRLIWIWTRQAVNWVRLQIWTWLP